MNEKQIWKAVLNEMELKISKAHFVTWFKNTYVKEIQNDLVIIAVPNGFSKEWLENRFKKKILKYIQKFKPGINKVRFEVVSINRDERENKYQYQGQSHSQTRNNEGDFSNFDVKSKFYHSSANNLNPKYTFENLIGGGHNELAKAASEVVCDEPGAKYNPLFIYGGVGLGKTHMLQAIGNKLMNSQKNFKIQYVTSEKFTNDFVVSVKEKKINEFKNIYRYVDVLLIDDIQFIGGKEGTQEQFFHTFNNLYQENKQIVLCSDRPPKSIPALEDRLCSRFEGGMIVDVTKPDVETRTAILLEKANNQNFPVAYETLNYIAKHITNNVRELEGYLNKFIATCQLKKLEPTIENAKEILGKDISKFEKQAQDPNYIINIICDFYKIETDKVKGKGRKSEIIKPRQVSVYVLRKRFKISFPIIGKIIGGRDHTTILHAYNKINQETKKNVLLKQEIDEIMEIIDQ